MVSIPWAVCGEWNAPKEPLERSIAVLVTEIVQPHTLGALLRQSEQFIHHPLYFSTLLCFFSSNCFEHFLCCTGRHGSHFGRILTLSGVEAASFKINCFWLLMPLYPAYFAMRK